MDDPLSDLETFRFNKDNYLTEIGKKPTSIQDIAGQYMGMIRFTPTSWQWIMDVIKKPLPKSIEKLDMTTLLEVLVENGHPAKVIADSGLWLECDTETDVEIYEKILYKGIIMIKADLHIHTTASDGQYSPSEVVKAAKLSGIQCIAITDHDTNLMALQRERRPALRMVLSFCEELNLEPANIVRFIYSDLGWLNIVQILKSFAGSFVTAERKGSTVSCHI